MYKVKIYNLLWLDDIEDAIDINPNTYLQSTLHMNTETNKNQNISSYPYR